MAREREPERLSTPGRRKRSLIPRPHFDRDTFGEFAEGFARFMGTARFLAYMSLFVLLWVVANVVGLFGLRWDPYPFILLNLFFSTQASYAAPLILLAQNRQEARDRVTLDRDRQQAAQSRADMDFLAREIASLRMSVGELATRDYVRSELRAELRAILAELEDDQEAADRSRDSQSRTDHAGRPDAAARGESARPAARRSDHGRLDQPRSVDRSRPDSP